MSDKISAILEELKGLSLLEASQLVKQIEETFGVDASASGGMMMVGSVAGAGESATEEKTEFDLVLESVPADKKIAILKIVRSVTGLGLKEAKDLVESAPKTVKASLPKGEADEIKKQLEEAGAKVSLN
jgi:large subunit ribosomal protein L7/L12